MRFLQEVPSHQRPGVQGVHRPVLQGSKDGPMQKERISRQKRRTTRRRYDAERPDDRQQVASIFIPRPPVIGLCIKCMHDYFRLDLLKVWEEGPRRHRRYERETRTFGPVKGRRPAGYVVASGESKAFYDPGILVEMPLVNQIRQRAAAWLAAVAEAPGEVRDILLYNEEAERRLKS